MKPQTPFKPLLLLVLLVAAGYLFQSCNKEVERCTSVCQVYDLSQCHCHCLIPADHSDTLILVNSMQELSNFVTCNDQTLPQIDFECYSLVIASGTVGGGIAELNSSIALQDDTYMINISILNDITAVASDRYVTCFVIDKIQDISDARFEVNKTFKLYVLESSFSGCLPDTLSGDTVIIQHNGSMLHLQHRLTLNCAATTVDVESSITNNTINIVYHVDDNVSANCVCPTQLEYWVGEVPEGNCYNVNFWLDGQIIHQENYFW